MFVAVWMSIAAVVGVASRELARRDIARQRRKGSFFADVRFASHWSSACAAIVLCGLVVVVSALRNPGATVAFHCMLAGTGTWLSLVDIDTHTVPRRSQMTVWCVAAVLTVVLSLAGDSVSLSGVATGSLAMWGVMKVIEALSRGDIGPADAVFAGYLGMFVGGRSVSLVPFALMTAFVTAGLVALVLMVVLRFGRRRHLPFAPFLFLGAVTAVLR